MIRHSQLLLIDENAQASGLAPRTPDPGSLNVYVNMYSRRNESMVT
jgi:hypothetical protein